MELRLIVEDAFMMELQKKLGQVRAAEVARSALTILNWAVGEVQAGRVILSATKNGEDVHRLAMPVLDQVSSVPNAPKKE